MREGVHFGDTPHTHQKIEKEGDGIAIFDKSIIDLLNNITFSHFFIHIGEIVLDYVVNSTFDLSVIFLIRQ